MRHSDRSSGRYLHPTPPQTIACSAFYEAEFLQIHNIRTSTASQTVTRAPQSLLVRLLMSPGWAKSEHRSGPHRVDGNRANTHELAEGHETRSARFRHPATALAVDST